MKCLFFSTIVVCAVLLASCGQVIVRGRGDIKTQTRPAADFSAIKITAPLNAVVMVQPGAPSVNLTGYESLLKHIVVEVKNNVLIIKTDLPDIDWETDKDLIANITLPSMRSIELNGAVEADVKGDVAGSELRCDMSGGTELKLENIHVTSLDVDISGAGDLEIASGVAEKVHYSISGAGEVSSYGLQANDVKAKVSGAGDIQLTALKTLDVRISGAGNISYKGNPAIQKNISGAGAVNAAD